MAFFFLLLRKSTGIYQYSCSLISQNSIFFPPIWEVIHPDSSRQAIIISNLVASCKLPPGVLLFLPGNNQEFLIWGGKNPISLFNWESVILKYAVQKLQKVVNTMVFVLFWLPGVKEMFSGCIQG